MKLFYSLLAVVLVAVGSNVYAMHGEGIPAAGYSAAEIFLHSVGTGVSARLVTYVGKKQAGLTNGQALGVALGMATLAVAAVQSQPRGGFTSGCYQLLGGIVSYAATMYLFPTTDIDAPAVSVSAKR